MSDILIKNMKMPENCLHCGFSHMASDCLKIWIICKPKDISVTDGDAVKDGRPDWCPLVEVPTPHGDLIDRDAVIDSVMQYCPDDDGIHSKSGSDIREMLDEIEEVTTIIEAEGT